MGIKHSVTKATNEKGYATEWNADHTITSDIPFNGHSGTGVGEQINPSDIATKNYVDSKPVGNSVSAYSEVIGNVSTNSKSYVPVSAEKNWAGRGTKTYIRTVSGLSEGKGWIIFSYDGINDLSTEMYIDSYPSPNGTFSRTHAKTQGSSGSFVIKYKSGGGGFILFNLVITEIAIG